MSSELNDIQRSLIDHIPNYFIFWKDLEGKYLGCNKAFAELAGQKSPKDLLGKTDYDYWPKNESDAFVANDKLVIASMKPQLNIEEPQTTPWGEKIVLSTTKVPFTDKQGNLQGLLGICENVTPQKEAAQKIVEANEKLKRANKVKSEFIRNISHDIRTPLGGIQLILQALSDNNIPTSEISEYACLGLDSSKKLMELFDQVIEVSEKEYFDFEDTVIKFDLYKLLQDLRQTYDIVAKHKGLVLDTECAENVARYWEGKHVRLHRILMNLLSNAFKFTNKGYVKLSVAIAQEEGEKTLLHFSVTDTGIGIPEENHEAIFEPFSRLHPSFENQYKGSGLGLHLVKDYVEKMGGEIYVKSQECQGSIFTCIIPFKRCLDEYTILCASDNASQQVQR